MYKKPEVIKSKLNDVGRDFDYRKKEILFDRFKMWFDNTTFKLTNDKFMGWGEYESSCGTLRIGTACFDGAEWLRHVQHTEKANNPYNNYVNAIAYWDMLNSNGKKFFLDFYNKEILAIKANTQSKINSFQQQIKTLKLNMVDIDLELDALTSTDIPT